MHLNFMPFLVIEGVLVVMIIVLVVWRQTVARGEDDTLHVLHGTLSQQTTIASKLAKIDKWGKAITVVAIALAVIVAGLYVYQYWIASGQISSAGA
jgi:hypothetical protein